MPEHISVKVSAGAKKESCVRVSAARFAISVKEKAEENRANRRVIRILAAHFRVPEGKVRLIRGHHAPSKVFSVG